MRLDQLTKLFSDTLQALRFFSVLPIPGTDFSDDETKLNEAVLAFSLAGLILAIPPAIIWYLASGLVSPFLSAALAIALGAAITGCLHEDGLADCFDGLGGAWDRERALEIMRDSAIGTYGAAALFFSFTFRILALTSLSPWKGAMALLMAYCIGRGALVIAIHTAQYARPSGLATNVREGTDSNGFYRTLGITLGLSLVIAVAGGGFSGLLTSFLALFAGLAAAWAMLQWLISRIGGYTGDGLGAMEQVAEISVLIALAALWS